jgi:hypothetical protein
MIFRTTSKRRNILSAATKISIGLHLSYLFV